MRLLNSITWLLFAGLTVLAGHGIADAQDATGATPSRPAAAAPPAAPPAAAPPTGADPGASMGVARQVNVTPAEQLAQSDAVLGRMDAARNVVRRQLETARQQRDVVKTLCLNDKLNQLDVALRSARDRRQALQLAATRNDADLANHEFTVLMVLRQRSEQLTAEANQCIGEEAGFVGESSVTATVDPTLPKDDPSAYPDDPSVLEPPSCVSCYQ